MNKLLEKNLVQIKGYCKDYHVDKLHVFGSITTNNFTENSDVDFLVKFKDVSVEQYTDGYFRLHELFELTLKRKVDLLTENSLSNPYFVKQVNQTKTLLYEGQNSN